MTIGLSDASSQPHYNAHFCAVRNHDACSLKTQRDEVGYFGILPQDKTTRYQETTFSLIISVVNISIISKYLCFPGKMNTTCQMIGKDKMTLNP